MRSVSRGDTKNVCLLFNSLLPPVKSEKEREKGEREKEREGKMSLFSLKKQLSFSLSFFSALSLSFFDILFWLSIRFFFPLFCTSFRWVRIKRWSSLSLFPSFSGGDRTNTSVRLSLSLSKKRAFWKTPTKPDDLPEQA